MWKAPAIVKLRKLWGSKNKAFGRCSSGQEIKWRDCFAAEGSYRKRSERMKMNLQQCEKEALVIDAARRGEWAEGLRAHTADCPVCSDAALAAQFLVEMQESDLAEVKVPSAG